MSLSIVVIRFGDKNMSVKIVVLTKTSSSSTTRKYHLWRMECGLWLFEADTIVAFNFLDETCSKYQKHHPKICPFQDHLGWNATTNHLEYRESLWRLDEVTLSCSVTRQNGQHKTIHNMRNKTLIKNPHGIFLFHDTEIGIQLLVLLEMPRWWRLVRNRKTQKWDQRQK